MHTAVHPAELILIDGDVQVVVRPRDATAGDPIMCREWNLGAPETRYTTTPRPGADGVEQGAGYLGSRTVTLDLQILGGLDPITGAVRDAYWYEQRLVAMTHPAANPVLQISRAGDTTGTYRLALKGNPFDAPKTRRSAALLELSLSFTAPLGLIEGPLKSFSTRASDIGIDALDWLFPAAFPKGFGPSADLVYPHLTFTVGGSAAVNPSIYITGPVEDPEVRVSNGEQFKFTGLTVHSGQTLHVDMESGVVRVGDVATGRIFDETTPFQAIDFDVSTFWRWQPGEYTVTYPKTSGVLTVQFRERLLTI